MPEPPPIDWEAPYGRDWVAVSVSLVYAPTFQRAQFEVVRMSISDRELKRKTALRASLPNDIPKDARESLVAIRRMLWDCDWDYWNRYLRKER
jgi:hypothetical protein